MAVQTARVPQRFSGRPRFQRPGEQQTGTGLWALLEAGLWVGNANGTYIGMIERSPHGFVASDGRGNFAGHFVSLDEAKAALSTERLSAEPLTA
ncbi:hypothetical protein [Leifsonia sp. NPDC058248]|uniref:hypothetical protein n=1 Tax=Leifsonia sp. NPDC058248 TaxID=3346402 RepID=UPI0036DF318A